ncbi:hypothetical protein [Nostoc sphaeroides]|nr:hypothetical protein [Nostoc sphaeroides]MCC5633504.1 hypothetical protein [Nostoc sphaeroides CHAB 2801]
MTAVPPQSPIQVIVVQNDYFFFSVYKGENEKLIVSWVAIAAIEQCQ